MKLEDIGFYTLSDHRAENSSKDSPLWRCEILLTGRCNFSCLYCRGSRTDGDMPLKKCKDTLDILISEGVKNIRFSGGEPTLYDHLRDIVTYCRGKVERIALSTNGSNDTEYYKELVKLGVNDFSISLDACCASVGDKMAGVSGAFDKVVYNIKELSKLTYVTVGCVFTKESIHQVSDTIELAYSLGVSDIRLISSAQESFIPNIHVKEEIVNKYPILRYRINNFNKGKNVRGISPNDSRRCKLVVDDLAIEGEYHYPCIIHLRETKQPIGRVGKNMREERYNWYLTHNCFNDDVCRKNCLDVCIAYNNKALKRGE